MPAAAADRSSRKRLMVAAAVAVAATGAVVLFWPAKKPAVTGGAKGGRVVCPDEHGATPASVAGLSKGDYVVVKLARGTVQEITWGRVLSWSRADRMELKIQLVGEIGKDGDGRKPLADHGFALDQQLVIAAHCVWDVLVRPKTRLVCGAELSQIPGPLPGTQRYKTWDTQALLVGEEVRLVAAGEGLAWHEAFWARVTAISQTQQIVHAFVLETSRPENGLKTGDEIQFARDCVVGIRPGGT